MPDLAPSSEECAELAAAATADEGRFETFEAYYPHFLCGHSKAGTKLLHFIATVMYLADVAAFATDGFRPVVRLRRRARSFSWSFARLCFFAVPVHGGVEGDWLILRLALPRRRESARNLS